MEFVFFLKHFVLASLYAESAERSWPNGRVDLGKRIPFGFVHCTQQTALTIDMMIGRSYIGRVWFGLV